MNHAGATKQDQTLTEYTYCYDTTTSRLIISHAPAPCVNKADEQKSDALVTSTRDHPIQA